MNGAGDRALVSVVIPCFNGARYLPEAIESALAQTYRPIEIIVVDDGSTDNSREVARSYEPRVRCQALAHSGIAGTRNQGVALSQGQFLAFLDADDLWSSDKLERQMTVFESDPEAGIVMGETEQFVSPELSEEAKARIEFASGNVTVRLPGATLIRRSEFERVGPFSTELVTAEFMDWVLRAASQGVKTVLIPGVVLRRRIHTTNHGILRKDAQSDYLRVVKASLDRRRKGGAESKPNA